MLKLLLGHWQSHREPLPFVLTDDPLYCSHLTKSPFPEVYSVNRINPIFEEEESNTSTHRHVGVGTSGDDVDILTNNQYRTFPTQRKAVKIKEHTEIFSQSPNFVLRKPVNKTVSNVFEYSSRNHFGFFRADSSENDYDLPSPLKRSTSEEAREDETKSSDDTGYSSSGQFKSLTTLDSDGSVEDHPMSSDSEDCSHPEAVIVSADVHRVSTPDDILVRSPSSESSANYSYRSYGSSPEPFDSLTMSSSSSSKDVENRKTNSAVKEKLQRLLEKGNNPRLETRKVASNSKEVEIQKTKNDLMKSLTRALNNKVPKRSDSDERVVTRSDDSNTKSPTLDRTSVSSSTTPKAILVNHNNNSGSESSGVTRQDESITSSLSSFTKMKKHQHSQPQRSGKQKESKTAEGSTDSSHKTHRCKVCENAHRPLAFHQLLPGHWSYDNVYLPQMHGMMCPCMHHHHAHSVPSSDDDVFFPPYMSRSRHSWALFSNNPHGHMTKEKEASSSSKEAGTRYSPDGETDSSNTSSSKLKKSFSERRSLREPKRCKCEHCLEFLPDKDPARDCPCYCLSPHRKVKFASDSDISQHKHLHSFRMKNGMVSGDPISAALVMSLPHLNGHVPNKGGLKENGKHKKSLPPLVPRGLKEPIKMDELYGTYPINFRDWESHYRRNFLQKRKKRALTMIGMAICIVMVVGIAVAMTFVFLRIKRPAS